MSKMSPVLVFHKVEWENHQEKKQCNGHGCIDDSTHFVVGQIMNYEICDYLCRICIEREYGFTLE